MKNGQPRLSEAAKHICQPEGITSTAWPGVRDRCGEMGVSFDRWQDGLGRLSLAKRSDGLYAAGVGGVVVSIPRQTGKTFLFSWVVFALCSIYPDMTVIWTAHRTRLSDETFGKMRAMARKTSVKPWIRGVRSANGQQEIEFVNGSRILFGARENGFGLGFDKVDILMLDEAQRLTETTMADMVPATNAAPNGLVIMTGTPPRPTDKGEVFTNRRRDALDGDPDTLFIEFSADDGSKIIDWTQLGKANPSFPHRTNRSAILRMQKLIGTDDNFRREAYGMWDEVQESAAAISRAAWAALRGPADTSGVLSLGVKFTQDGAGVALAAAYNPGDDLPIYVEPIKQANMGEGLEWLVDYLVAAKGEAAQIVVDGKAGSGGLINSLRMAGVRSKRQVIAPSTAQVIDAHSMFLGAVNSGLLTHPGVQSFDDQVLGAEKRKIGNGGGFGWQPIDHEETTVTLDAATLAYWAARTTKRKPGRKQVIS